MEPEDQLVWVPHSTMVYAIGRIKKTVDSNQVLVELEQDGQELQVTKNSTQIINPTDLRDFTDMVDINDLSESYLLHNLRHRHKNNKIYTWIGNVLVSINPFKLLNLYGNDKLTLYSDASRVRELEPHIFSVASMAYAGLRSDRKSQSVIISGESGSGKTEASKSLLEFLAHRSGGGTIATDILRSNPILEAFGNATTTRNNNSSRFGKFIKVEFDVNGAMRGATVSTYLLEKSRISHRPDLANMNYHIFYYLVNGASNDERKRWSLENTSVERFRYLQASPEVLARFNKSSPDGLDASAKSIQKVREALSVFGCGNDECNSIFQTIAAVLHLGNIEFVKDESNYASIDNRSNTALETTAKLLGYPPALFRTALISRNLKAIGRGSVYSRPMEVTQAEEARDSLAKSLYAKIFQFIVEKINQRFNNSNSNNNSTTSNLNSSRNSNNSSSGDSKLFIGVLDIFGFENMTSNSLEQLLINFTNEKLQSQFIQEVFEREQKDYVSEGITWQNANFSDNKQCLELIEKKGQGLLALLDDECVMPKGSETTLHEKYNRTFLNNNNCYQRSLAKGTFGVKHFAGDVVYQMDGWLEKNRDTLFGDLEELLSGSSNQFVRSLFQKNNNSISNSNSTSSNSLNGVPPGSGSPSMQKKATGTSVSGQFQEQLTSLLSTLATTSLSYVRCVKPNSTLSSDSFNSVQVMTQLRSVGLLATVLVRKQGYSYRRDFKSFVLRYSVLLSKFKKQQNQQQPQQKKIINNNSKSSNNNNIDYNQSSKIILELIQSEYEKHLEQTQKRKSGSNKKLLCQVGKNKVFISDELYIFLEKFREQSLDDSVRCIQRHYRMYRARKQFLLKRQSAIILQCCIRSHLKRKEVGGKIIAERKRLEEERIKEEERKKKEEEKRKREEEKQRQEEETRRKKEEEKRKRDEEDAKRKEDERIKKEEERKKKEEEKQRKEEEKHRKEEEKRKKKEEKDLQKKKNHAGSSTTDSGVGGGTFANSSSSESEDDPIHRSSSFEDGIINGNNNGPGSPIEIWRKREIQTSNKVMQSPPLRQRTQFQLGNHQQQQAGNSNSSPNSSPNTSSTSLPLPITSTSQPIPIVNKNRQNEWIIKQSPKGRPSPSTNRQTRIGRMTLRSSNLELRLNSPSSTVGSPTPSASSYPSSGISSGANISSTPSTPSHVISPISSPTSGPSSPMLSPPTTSPAMSMPFSLSPPNGGSSSSSTPSGSDSPVNIYPPETEKNLQMRTKIIEEIIETEKDYVRDLQLVVEVFLTPIREKSMLQTKDINILFSNLEILLNINKTMLEELEKDDEPSHYNTKVGQAFLKMSHYLKMYNAYCSNQQAALKILEDEQEKNETFRTFLENCMNDSKCRGLPLLSFIIKPVQRICKYPLLLRETLRYTSEFHSERIPLEEAEKKINIVVTSVNEGKRTIEMFQKILEIQSTIENIDEDLVKPGRVLLQEATVTAVRELGSTDKETLQRSIFLFNDLVLICGPASVITSAINNFKTKKHIYRLKGRIPISEARIMFVSDTDSVKFAVEICHLKEDDSSKHILCFNTEQQRSQWLKQIKSMIQEYKFNISKLSSPFKNSPISASSSSLLLSPIVINK